MSRIEGRGWEGLPDLSKTIYKATYFKPNDTYDKWLARITMKYANDSGHAIRMYNYIHNYWMHPSTPIASDRGLPIACYVSHIPDNNEGIFEGFNEGMHLGAGGGGRGVYWGDVGGFGRPIGDYSKSYSWKEIQEDEDVVKSSGIIPFLGVSDRATYSISQANVRRSTEAAYIPIHHPDILDFIEIRLETGDKNRRMPNLHHGVVITDKFMEAVKSLDSFDLICPHTGLVTNTVDAFDLWMDILLIRKTEAGEPYLLFIDTINRDNPVEYNEAGYIVSSSNICCLAGDTEVATLEGTSKIKDLVGKEVTIFDGKDWVRCNNFTEYGEDDIIRIHLKNGTYIDSNSKHRWFAATSYTDIRYGAYKEFTTSNLVEGMWLEDNVNRLADPDIFQGGVRVNGAYLKGFLLGDGTHNGNRPLLNIHSTKYQCIQSILTSANELPVDYVGAKVITKFSVTEEVVNKQVWGRQEFRRLRGLTSRSNALLPFASSNKVKPLDFNGWDTESKLLLLSGLLDADGTYPTSGIQLTSISSEFIGSIQSLLFTLGITSSIDSVQKELPYKTLHRLTIGNYDSFALYKQLSCARLEAPEVAPNRRTTGYRQIVKIEKLPNKQKVYCPQVPTTKKFMLANGVMTGNTEITSVTTPDLTSVCCLLSFNLEQWDEYKDSIEVIVADVSDYLSNVLLYTVKAIDGYPEAKKRAFRRVKRFILETMEIGIGVMGWHSLLQKKHIAFESPMAVGLNLQIITAIKNASDKHQAQLPLDSRCELSKLYGTHKRNLRSLAIAPTMSISSLSKVCSSGVEPWVSNAFVKKIPQGSFSIKNKYLSKIINNYALDTYSSIEEQSEFVNEQWKSIIKHGGSVQHLEWLDDYSKDVFKTAFEIDQRQIIKLASDRQKVMTMEHAQSINIFLPAEVTYEELYQIHMMAWEEGLNSLYYLRSQPAATAEVGNSERKAITLEDDVCVSCT